MSHTEILGYITALLRELGILTYLQVMLIVAVAIALLRRLFDRG
jgi:hypothetical protein